MFSGLELVTECNVSGASTETDSTAPVRLKKGMVG